MYRRLLLQVNNVFITIFAPVIQTTPNIPKHGNLQPKRSESHPLAAVTANFFCIVGNTCFSTLCWTCSGNLISSVSHIFPKSKSLFSAFKTILLTNWRFFHLSPEISPLWCLGSSFAPLPWWSGWCCTMHVHCGVCCGSAADAGVAIIG